MDLSTAKSLVVKIGGAEGVAPDAICTELATLAGEGISLVVVHGGSHQANQLGEDLGYPPRFVKSPSGFTSRFTDQRTLEIFTMAVRGALNTQLVATLQANGVNALGLSGVDGRLLKAHRKSAIRVVENGRQKVLRGDFTGQITQVDGDFLQALLDRRLVPVLAPLAVTEEAEVVNVDADRAAAQVAAALPADGLILLTAVEGLLQSFPDPQSLIRRLRPPDLEGALEIAQGRMKKKILGAQEALAGGVPWVMIADGRLPNAIRKALAGKGTLIA